MGWTLVGPAFLDTELLPLPIHMLYQSYQWGWSHCRHDTCGWSMFRGWSGAGNMAEARWSAQSLLSMATVVVQRWASPLTGQLVATAGRVASSFPQSTSLWNIKDNCFHVQTNREPRSPARFVIVHSDHWWSEHEERVNGIYLWEIKWASVCKESHHSGMIPDLVDRPLLHSGHLWAHRHPMTPRSSARELSCTGLNNWVHPIQPSCNGSQRMCVKIKFHCKVSIRDTFFEGKHFSYSEVEWKRLHNISQTLGMWVSHPLHVYLACWSSTIPGL